MNAPLRPIVAASVPIRFVPRDAVAAILDRHGFTHAADAVRAEGLTVAPPEEFLAAWETWIASAGDCFRDPLAANRPYRAPRRLRGNQPGKGYPR